MIYTEEEIQAGLAIIWEENEYDDEIRKLYNSGTKFDWQMFKEQAEKRLKAVEEQFGRNNELFKDAEGECIFWNRYQEEWDKKYKNKPNFYLQRFINAQEFGNIEFGTESYATALEEIKSGRKKTHWIWYVFPQLKGLGKSYLSQFYGLNGREEAKAYIEHPFLKEKLIEATEAVLNNAKDAYSIFGNDVVKFRSCMLLFASISDEPIFNQVIAKYGWK